MTPIKQQPQKSQPLYFDLDPLKCSRTQPDITESPGCCPSRTTVYALTQYRSFALLHSTPQESPLYPFGKVNLEESMGQKTVDYYRFPTSPSTLCISKSNL